jgi:hypothetical protein
MKKKYETKNPSKTCDKPMKVLKFQQSSIENKQEMFVSINNKKVVNNLLDPTCKFLN